MTTSSSNQNRNLFRFKQFEVDQTGCAMRVNTDGVLLGAMASGKNPKHILDIGTGTGVIALMLAQRFKKAAIHAVEIDENAAATAGRNFQSSVFHDRLSISNTAIEQFNDPQQFDLIVSNPPYFVNDLKSSEEKKGLARHTDVHFFKTLLAKVDELLTAEGTFWFVLPVKQAEMMVNDGVGMNLHLKKLIHLHSDESKPEFRRIVALCRTKIKPEVEHFYIYQSEKVYTDAYIELLKDFFLRLGSTLVIDQDN
jgi:tRNA1Val (adenine37-N6)-methyltransferase